MQLLVPSWMQSFMSSTSYAALDAALDGVLEADLMQTWIISDGVFFLQFVCATFGFSLCSAVYGWTFQPGVRVSQVLFFRQVHSASPM